MTIFGFLESSEECSIGQTVEIQRRVIGPRERWRDFRIEVTDTGGNLEVTFRPRRNGEYKGLVRRDATCQREESTARLVHVRAKVVAHVDDTTPQRDTNFRIYGRVEPGHDGTEVRLQWRRNGRWRTAFVQELSDRSTFSFFPLAEWRSREIRIKWPRGDYDHIAGYSRTFVIRTH